MTIVLVEDICIGKSSPKRIDAHLSDKRRFFMFRLKSKFGSMCRLPLPNSQVRCIINGNALFFLREINGNALGYLFGDKMAKPGLIGLTCEYTNIFDIYLPKHFIVIIGIRLCCSFVFIFVRLLKVEPVACIVRPHCRHGQLANVLLKGKV
jgi:hypothetical protein